MARYSIHRIRRGFYAVREWGITVALTTSRKDAARIQDTLLAHAQYVG